jgi:hypothetical protein
MGSRICEWCGQPLDQHQNTRDTMHGACQDDYNRASRETATGAVRFEVWSNRHKVGNEDPDIFDWLASPAVRRACRYMEVQEQRNATAPRNHGGGRSVRRLAPVRRHVVTRILQEAGEPLTAMEVARRIRPKASDTPVSNRERIRATTLLHTLLQLGRVERVKLKRNRTLWTAKETD